MKLRDKIKHWHFNDIFFRVFYYMYIRFLTSNRRQLVKEWSKSSNNLASVLGLSSYT